MKISEVWIYPIKSCGGIRRPHGHELLPTGFRFDRLWMVVDENGKFVTQREKPQMATVRMQLRDDNQIWMKTGHGWSQLKGPSQDRRAVQVWESNVKGAVDANETLGEFFSDLLGQKAFLVTAAPEFNREVEGQGRVHFADSHPLLVTTEESLAELNTRFKEPVPMQRFRPNLVIKGALEPYAEDAWEKIQVSGTTVAMRKLCSRCPIITIDQASGKKKGPEPLATLAKYRRKGTQVYFGVRGWSETPTFVREGDAVQILSNKTG